MTRQTCIFCERASDTVPLLTLEYKGSSFRLCSQHLPVLIHDPSQLIGLLPEAERLEASEHVD